MYMKWLNAHQVLPWFLAPPQVFLYQGRLHVIPKPRSPADIGILPVTTPTIRTAVDLVRSERVQTEASEGLQECIRKRLAA